MTQISLKRKISLRVVAGALVFLLWFFLPAVLNPRIAEEVTIGTALVLGVLTFLHERFRIVSIEKKEE